MRRQRLFLSTMLGLAVAAAACARSESGSPFEPSAPAMSQSLVGGLLDAVLLQCVPLRGATYSAMIGEAGGTLQIGPHELVIPRGALKRSTRITAEIVSDKVNSIRFSPEGLRFEKATSLTMSYSNCPLAGLLPLKKVAYTSEGLNLLELLRSLDRPAQKTVTGQVEHFSRYAIAY